MNKVLTVVIPSYNVEKYIRTTLDSFISEEIMSKIEVLIVNDGSKDNTAKIAEEYVNKCPQTFRLINKENGGHGSTINRGIIEATGNYFKVVDGDDWVNTKDFTALVYLLEGTDADYVVTNYYKVNDKTLKKELEDFSWLKTNYINTFRDFGNHFRLEMHALTIRTEILKKNKIHLDEHCFYVDKEYINYPIPYVNTIRYFDLCVYMYRLAISTQSVSIQGFKKHLLDHVKVTQQLIDFAANYERSGGDKDKAAYLNYQAARMVVVQASIFSSFSAFNKKIRKQFQEFDAVVKKKSQTIYDLSDAESRMLHSLRKNKFKGYWFWITLSKFHKMISN